MYPNGAVDTLFTPESPANIQPNPSNVLERIQLWETPTHIIPWNLSTSLVLRIDLSKRRQEQLTID